MKFFFNTFTIAVLLFIVALILPKEEKNELPKQKLQNVKQIKKSKKKDDYNKIIKELENSYANKSKKTIYYLKDIKNKQLYNIQSLTNIYNKRLNDYSVFVSFKNNKYLNIAALGTDNKYHLSNYYLEGFAPFKTSNIFLPLITIAKKKTYQLDHFGKLKKKEVWQRSKEAYTLPRGDCEDHAIAIADWLIENGEDAKVVIGKYKDGGHAWVLLKKDKKEYIIEATAKSNFTKAYKIAKYATNYKPEAMFNRKHFWYNIGSSNTTNYSSNKWIKKSEYIQKVISY